MNRGFVEILFAVVLIAAIMGGIAWWVLAQDPSISATSTSSIQTQTVSGIFSYSANEVAFPSRVFHLTGDRKILGADYVRVRNTTKAVYALLGADAGIPLADSCQWVVNASIEIANAKLDTETYAYMSPAPAVAVADFVKVVSHEEPRQVCATP